MRPIKFKDQNCIFAENQPEYLQLPVLKLDTKEGEVISCWKMSLYERIKCAITGRVWVSMMSFNRPINPIFITSNKHDLYKIK